MFKTRGLVCTEETHSLFQLTKRIYKKRLLWPYKQLTVLRRTDFSAQCSGAVTIYKHVCQYDYLFASPGCSYI